MPIVQGSQQLLKQPPAAETKHILEISPNLVYKKNVLWINVLCLENKLSCLYLKIKPECFCLKS